MAVASILVIRLFLKLTGYPKLGGEKLHIAHVLWGSLLMAMAILMLLLFLGKSRERLEVIVGGVGIGIILMGLSLGHFLIRRSHDERRSPGTQRLGLPFHRAAVSHVCFGLTKKGLMA